jgi:hypothetical protein
MPARALAWFAILFSVGGCTGDGLDHTVKPDLGNTVSDLAMPGSPDLATAAYPDLAVAASPDLGQLSCAAMVACTRMCGGGAQMGQCVQGCIQRGSNDAITWFDPLSQCAGPACYQSNTGAAPCGDPSSNACIECVTQSCGSELDACMMH